MLLLNAGFALFLIVHLVQVQQGLSNSGGGNYYLISVLGTAAWLVPQLGKNCGNHCADIMEVTRTLSTDEYEIFGPSGFWNPAHKYVKAIIFSHGTFE